MPQDSLLEAQRLAIESQLNICHFPELWNHVAHTEGAPDLTAISHCGLDNSCEWQTA